MISLKNTYQPLFALAFLLPLTFSCSDILDDSTGSSIGGETNNGEKILFTVGTTDTSVSSRAGEEGTGTTGNTSTDPGTGTTVTPGKSYYMPHGSRFVCRMYYYANSGVDKLDITGGSDFIAWLKVDGTIGNSLYWNKFFEPVGTNEGYGGIDNLGNDYSADAFYWQNRKPHVFLAMTDLNQATNENYKYGIDEGKLKLTPADEEITIQTNNMVDVWEPIGYNIEGVETSFTNWDGVKRYVDDDGHGLDDEFIANQNNCSISEENWDEAQYQYMYGWSCKYSESFAKTETYAETIEGEDITIQKYGPIKYLMYYQTYPYEQSLDGLTPVYEVTEQGTTTGKILSYKDMNGLFVCNVVYTKDSEGHDNPSYVQCDEYGNTLYNEANPKYTFYYYEIREQHSIPQKFKYNVNKFDLTKGTKTSINQQPDICQAIRSQEPLGATQISNRVNLYFKHQFSQVQVNLKNAADNSVNITAGQLKNVELLGVSDSAYVCIDLNEDGEINHAPMYKAVKASDFTGEQLTLNPYGTSFDMFDMGENNYAAGYLKSFNCITFGQLQAIRITWQEEGNNIKHTATYRVTETDLQNLRSGYKYVWNMELRRGTLAVVRTEVENWIVPESGLEYGTSGTVNN